MTGSGITDGVYRIEMRSDTFAPSTVGHMLYNLLGRNPMIPPELSMVTADSAPERDLYVRDPEYHAAGAGNYAVVHLQPGQETSVFASCINVSRGDLVEPAKFEEAVGVLRRVLSGAR